MKHPEHHKSNTAQKKADLGTDLFTLTKEILYGKQHFLRSVK